MLLSRICQKKQHLHLTNAGTVLAADTEAGLPFADEAAFKLLSSIPLQHASAYGI